MPVYFRRGGEIAAPVPVPAVLAGGGATVTVVREGAVVAPPPLTHTLPVEPGAYHFLLPCGIGDVAWLASKLVALGKRTGREVRIAMPAAEPKRGHQIIERIDGLTWAGYEPGMTHGELVRRNLLWNTPAEQIPHSAWVCLSANGFLEAGRSITGWLPDLPHDYHLPIRIDAEERARADALLADLPEPIVTLYCSNRSKDEHAGPAWRLWSTEQWFEAAEGLRAIFPGCGFVILGAKWDEDKTGDLGTLIEAAGYPLARCVGETLGVALACMQRSVVGVHFNGGLAFLGDMLRCPTFCLMPKDAAHRNLCTTPVDPENKAFRAVSGPTVRECLDWVAARPWETPPAKKGKRGR